MPVPSDIPLTTLDGKAETLGAFDGKALSIVNVASKCAFTPQYEARMSCPIRLSFPRTRESSVQPPPIRGQVWIPAFAGMTRPIAQREGAKTL